MENWICFASIAVAALVAFLCFSVYMILQTLGCFARRDFDSYGEPPDSYKAGTILMLDGTTASEKLDEIELHDVSIRLNLGESCYFEGDGCSYHVKEIVTGYRNSSHGSSIRVMKGYSIRKSEGQSHAIRQTMHTEYPGRLYITNERIVFLAEKYGFDIRFDKLSNITIYDQYLEVFAGRRFFRVYTVHCVFIRDLITLMNMCHQENRTTK